MLKQITQKHTLELLGNWQSGCITGSDGGLLISYKLLYSEMKQGMKSILHVGH